MRALLFLVALALAAAPAAAQEGTATNATGSDGTTPGEGNATGGDTGGAPAAPEPVTFTLVSQAGGGAFWWVLEGQTARNPTLTVAPGQQVTIVIKNGDGGFHNLALRAPVNAKTPDIAAEGDTQSVTFTAPQSGSVSYVCEYHASTMAGRVVVGGGAAPPAGGGESDSDIQGDAVPLGSLVTAEAPCAERAVPAVVGQNVIGGPTANDYLERCLNPNAGAETAEQPDHPADYVIPLSWLLIGLGIVGVVWVHRFYKP